MVRRNVGRDDQPILEDDRTRTPTLPIPAISDQLRPDVTYIHTEYHLSSGRDSKEDLLEEYLACREKPKVGIDDSPWHPFKSKLDFELVEFILQAGLNEGNGTSERVYTEPWTGNIFWEVQSALPVNGKPICYIIYADKIQLSSFGTVQGYPVIVRLGNLPAHIRDGQGVGGRRVIRWLPIVLEESQHRDKTYYADFKRAIWHKAFEIILSSIQVRSKIGAWVQSPNSDIVPWYLFPTIMILSADYEEQMSFGALNIVMSIGLSRLINYHLLEEIIGRIEKLKHSQSFAQQADEQLSTFPPWKDLYCFKQGFTCLTFMDGQKYEMLSKLPPSRMSEAANTGCPNSEYEKIKQAALDAGKQPPKKLTFKTWDFPKVHLHKHLFDDIEAKGVMLNYNTKPNESMHGAFKESYQQRTNFKDFEKQILQIDQWYNAMSFICQQIDVQEEQLANSAEEKDSDEIDDSNQPERETETANSQPDYVSAASGGGRLTITEVEAKAADNPDFSRFRKLLSKYMAQHFKSHPEELPLINGAAVAFESFAPNDRISLYGMLKSYYPSLANWQLTTDFLRCSPSFNHHPRYNFILIDTVDGPLFAQLVMVFECTIHEKIFPLILIQPFNQPTEGLSAQKDQDLGFYYVRMDMKKSKPHLVSIYSVLWGALLIEDPDVDPKDEDVKEYLVVDVVDADMEINHSIMLLAGNRLEVVTAQVYTPAGVEEQAKATSDGASGNNSHTFDWGHLSRINFPCSLSAKVFRPQSYPLLSKEKICQVKCGANHVLVLTTDGHILMWGFGTRRELRRKEQHHTSSLKPEQPSLGNIVTIGAGSHQSFAVDSSGLVYGWGLNHVYQLGLGTKQIGPDTSVFLLTLIDSLHPSLHGGARVIAINGGEFHTIFLFDNGNVYGCGRCNEYAIGLAKDHSAMIALSLA
ncbi:hypothetical protein F5146DRAFT_1004106 [Armillaria mellea]|nr:hypothetical protein F5146DRAFT_1004106 [Armillaria mellea]